MVQKLSKMQESVMEMMATYEIRISKEYERNLFEW